MIGMIRKLASLKLTLAGMALLAVLSLAGARSDLVDVDWTALPLGILTLNLVAAIISNRSFRTQAGLLVFHVGLLLVFLLIGLTVVTRFDGRIEMLEGEAFDPARIVVDQRGLWHPGELSDIRFTQGGFEVDYLPGLLRQATRSSVAMVDETGTQRRRVVDARRGLDIAGYRLLPTANKGFALVLGWEDDAGRRRFGAVHFPSYPKHDWKQLNDWVTPAGQPVQLELDLENPPVMSDAAWTLRRPDGGYRLMVRAAGEAIGVVGEGAALELIGGRLVVAELRLWMGYSIDYYPFLPWMFAAAMLAIAGLAFHFSTRYLPRPGRATAMDQTEAPDACVART